LVERWFTLLTQKQLRRGVHRTLETAIVRYITIKQRASQAPYLEQNRGGDSREG